MNKTWLLWKSTFLEDHEGPQRQIQACGGSNQFGSANTTSITDKPFKSLTGVTPNILKKMDDYMDNISNAVTNEKDVLDQIVAINAKQSSTIATRSTNTISLSDNSNQLQLRIINKGSRGGRVVKSENVRKYLKDGYLWFHGYKVLHMIPNHKNNKEGQKEKSICVNTMKGMNINKRWGG